MLTYVDSHALRQASYIRRSARARVFAWFLMPVTGAVFSAALWSDPALQPKLKGGLEEIKPVLAAAMKGDFSTDEARALQEAAREKAAELNAKIASLPVSRMAINHPDDGG